MNKQRKALIRERDRQAREREEQQTAARAAELQTRTGGFSRTVLTPEKAKAMRKASFIEAATFKEARDMRGVTQRQYRDGPSLDIKQKETPRYSGEMAERQRAAEAEYEVMKSRTGPVYNKGGDQYFTEDMVREMRTGTLRRRN